jgi:RNA polymerase sigma-70 factor, ECF subfamily
LAAASLIDIGQPESGMYAVTASQTMRIPDAPGGALIPCGHARADLKAWANSSRHCDRCGDDAQASKTRRGHPARAAAAGAGADDAGLVTSAKDGHPEAFELLAQRHWPLAYRVALHKTGNHHDAQDVAQESLVAAWQNLARYRAEASFSTWLYQIVTRRALNKVARGRGTDVLDPRADITDGGSGPADTVLREHAAEAVTAAVATLPRPQRAAVVLHHLEGFSYAEVAAITTSTVPAVRSHLYRARRALTAILDQWR